MRVLLLSTTTGYQLRSFGDSAERLGIDLLLATDRCHQLDDPWRDGALPVRFHEEEFSLVLIRDAVKRLPLSGVLAVGDRPAVLAARVAETFALPGNTRAAADASRNKKLMRQRFAHAGLQVPWFIELPSRIHVSAVADAVRYPCVVKPLGLSGSRGVIRADNREQLEKAVERSRALLERPAVRAFRNGLDEALLVEGFIEGREYAIEGLVTDGQLRVLAIFDKPEPLDGPFFEETIYVTPSSAPAAVQESIVGTSHKAITAMGLTHGAIHAECRVAPGGIVILEVAARPIGGLCSKVLRFESGDDVVPLESLLLRHACGQDVSRYARERRTAGVMMIPIPKRGLLKGVSGLAAARRTALVEEIHITAKPEQLIEPLPEGDSYLGFIFARGERPAEVVAALREAHHRLAFRIEPEIMVTTETMNYER